MIFQLKGGKRVHFAASIHFIKFMSVLNFSVLKTGFSSLSLSQLNNNLDSRVFALGVWSALLAPGPWIAGCLSGTDFLCWEMKVSLTFVIFFKVLSK